MEQFMRSCVERYCQHAPGVRLRIVDTPFLPEDQVDSPAGRPICDGEYAKTVAVVVPSPATSFVFAAAWRINNTPVFSMLSTNSICPFWIPGHIAALEGRAAVQGPRWTAGGRSKHGQRSVRLVDNFGLAVLLEKGQCF